MTPFSVNWSSPMHFQRQSARKELLMRRIGNITIAALAALGLTASAPSFAQRHFHGGARVGVYVGVPW